MINVHFVILGAVCSLTGALLYARDTVRGRNQPNRVTWLMWGAIPMVTFSAEVQAGVGLRSLMTLFIGVGPLVVFLVSFANRAAVWRIGALDYLCGAMSLAGLVVWLATQKGTVAIAASIAADALAGFPTVRKAWLAPETESANSYIGSFASGVITLLTVHVVTTAEVAFPLYIAVVTAVELTLVVGRIGPRLRELTAGEVTAEARGHTGGAGADPGVAQQGR